MSAFSSLLIPAVLFFALGFIARLIKSDLSFPPDLAKILAIYLLVSIGLHGGVELAHADLGEAFAAVFWALVLGLTLPIVGFALLLATKSVAPLDAAAIAAHYGSVSAGTFLTAIAFLASQGVDYERYPLIMLAVMESPAIIIGLLLASWARGRAARTDHKVIKAAETGDKGRLRELLHEALTNGSVVLLIGAMVIGAIADPKAMESLEPFTTDIFMGMLCLFLLEMGMEAGRRFGDFRRVGLVLGGFGLVMPLIGGVIGVLVGHLILGFGVGGTTLVGVLGASASYIAVPPAMRLAIPEANPSLYLTLSLGVTFPFNVVIGIPLYHALAQMLAGGG
ncbi:MAG: sodium-dependent bicarbonate transport family permease [Sphingobacteriia bacterium]|nr:sodium-dependent bicarbonate transport family permease [Sphingobacteriia bacterium]NCC38072.1 sodium-dependent bicarbonate transport family permease [Gammaproteobacteria bacterium]